MEILIKTLAELLKAYERTTPCIDQALVRRVLAVQQWAEKFGRVYSKIGLGLILLVLSTTACSKKGEDAPPPNNPHVSGVWSGNGTDDAIGYYNVTATLTQSGNQAAGTFTMAGNVATINGNISMSFGAIGAAGGANMGAVSLQRTTWTVPNSANANRVCQATMTITPGTGSITNTATAFHYSVTDCQGGTWYGGMNMQKTAGTN